jgi:NADH:ubiquinone oxidoreductase subunit 3 (subunit A)
MDSGILAAFIFILFSVLTPVSLILTSRMLRGSTKRNPVKDTPYESAEESRGSRISIMNEYLHYFSMFIAFEIIVTVVLVWAPVSKSVSFLPSVAVMGLIAGGIVLEAFLLLIARMVEHENGG